MKSTKAKRIDVATRTRLHPPREIALSSSSVGTSGVGEGVSIHSQFHHSLGILTTREIECGNVRQGPVHGTIAVRNLDGVRDCKGLNVRAVQHLR